MAFTQIIIDFSVVVFGILLALFLNRLNAKRKKRKKIKNILSIISSNMSTDIKNIDKTLNHFEEHEHLLKDVVNGKTNSVKNSPLKENEIKFIQEFLGTFWKVPMEKRGYYLLKDVNIDYELKDDRLLTEIIYMYDNLLEALNLTNKIIENNLERSMMSTINRFPTDTLLKYFLNDFEDRDSIDYDMIDEQLKDKKFRINIALHHSLYYKSYLDLVKKWKIKLEEIIKKINDKKIYS